MQLSYLGIPIRYELHFHDVVQHHPCGKQLCGEKLPATRAERFKVQSYLHRVRVCAVVLQTLFKHLGKEQQDEQAHPFKIYYPEYV